MRYQPTDLPNRSYVGEKWTRYQLRSLQIIMQATHGVVSGSPQFFRRAFGDSEAAFHELLLWPHKFTFNREYYEKSLGKAEFDEFKSKFSRLAEIERAELLRLLSSTTPRHFKELLRETKSKQLRGVLRFYIPLTKNEELAIWHRTKKSGVDTSADLPEDERVEDAGLTDNVFDFMVQSKKSHVVVGHA